MGGVSFYLKNPKADRSKIYVCAYPGKLRKPTPLVIQPADWNQRKNLSKSNGIINNRLKKIENDIWDLINANNLNESTLDAVLNPKSELSENFVDIIDRFNVEYKISESTKKQYSQTRRLIFENWPKHKVEQINKHWHRELIDKLVSLNYQKNTAGNRIKNLKTILKWSEDDYSVPGDYKKWKVFTAPKDVIYHSREELEKLSKTRFIGVLQKVVDMHLLQCNIGVRYSDMKKLKPANRRGDKLFLSAQKGSKSLVIPMSDTAKAIWDKYNGMFEVMSEQNQRDYIKKACQQAGITQDVIISKHYLDRVDQSTVPKYQLIATHTARRTFVTISLELGIPPEVIMSITGHSTYKMMQKYFEVADHRKFEAMQKWNAG